MVLSACSFNGYRFNGASIDYTKTKTIQIADFPIRSSYVWGPMGPMFNNALNSVQAQLVEQIIDDIVDQIFNATVANW